MTRYAEIQRAIKDCLAAVASGQDAHAEVDKFCADLARRDWGAEDVAIVESRVRQLLPPRTMPSWEETV